MKTFRERDIVKYAEEWSHPEERHIRLIVLEAFDDVQRALIGSLNTNLSLGKVESVDYEWIEHCTRTEAIEALKSAKHSYRGIRLEEIEL